MSRIVYDPYESVGWDSVEFHKSDVHTHVRGGDVDAPHEIVDIYAGDAPDTDGNTMEDGEEYTIFAMGQISTRPSYFPWQEFSDLPMADDDWENRDPAEMRDGDGVVAIPASETSARGPHHYWMFTTLANDKFDEHYGAGGLRNTIPATWELEEYEEPRGLSMIPHPIRYYNSLDNDEDETKNPTDGAAWLLKYFQRWDRETGLLGIEAFNKNSGVHRGGSDDPRFGSTRNHLDIELWDQLNARLAPDTMVWGFSTDDNNDPNHIGSRIDIRCMELLIDEGDFDPGDQEGSRAAAADAYQQGRFISHSHGDWDFGEEPRPQRPVINEIDVDNDSDTISVDADHVEESRWISRGGVVETGSQIQIDEDVQAFVRYEMRSPDGVLSSLQPFGVERPDNTLTNHN